MTHCTSDNEGSAISENVSVDEEESIITSERRDSPTPNGGDYSEIFYFDDDGNSVDKKVATQAIIRECKKDGTLVYETFGFINKPREIEINENEESPTSERISVDEGLPTNESVTVGCESSVSKSVSVNERSSSISISMPVNEESPTSESVLADKVTSIITSERSNNPTPNGGDYSEIFYFDDDGNSVDKKVATKAVVREYKEDGTLINEIFADINK